MAEMKAWADARAVENGSVEGVGSLKVATRAVFPMAGQARPTQEAIVSLIPLHGAVME